MDKFIINGGIRLKGEVQISGSKNAALPIMAASILSPNKNTILKIPELSDVFTMGKLLKYMGAKFSYSKGRIEIDTSRLKIFEAPYNLVKAMRASVLTLAPMLAIHGRASVSLPGGCAIGARPINLHLMGLEKMGAKIEIKSGYIIAKANRLKGASISFDILTVTGTENMMMAGVLAKGTTILKNVAREPEVVDLANCLISMGAKINGAGQSVIEIIGVAHLKPICEYEIITDRIEAATFLSIVGICGGELTLKGAKAQHLESVISKLQDTGIKISTVNKGLNVSCTKKLIAQDINTMPYPWFPTDMQAQFMAMMTIAKGVSIIKETIFENRFMHVAELRRMGADISIDGRVATVKGVDRLVGAPVMATDLRAGAALVMAALCAKGQSNIHRIYHLDRGYENMDKKLQKIGADIKRVKESTNFSG